MMFFLPFSLAGFGSGVVAGLATSPVAITIVQALIALPAAVVALVAARKPGNALREALPLVWGIAGFGVGIGGGVPAGVYLRSSGILAPASPLVAPTVEPCEAAWTPALCADYIAADIEMDRLLVPEAVQESWRASVRQHSSELGWTGVGSQQLRRANDLVIETPSSFSVPPGAIANLPEGPMDLGHSTPG